MFLEVSCILSIFTDKLVRQVLQSRMKSSVCLQEPTLPTHADSSGKTAKWISGFLLFTALWHACTYTSTEKYGKQKYFPGFGQSTEEVGIHGQHRPGSKLKLNIITTPFVNKITAQREGTIWLFRGNWLISEEKNSIYTYMEHTNKILEN